MSPPLGIAVVGLGLAGSLMVEAIRTHPNVQVTAAVDPNADVRERWSAAETAPAFHDIADVIARPDVDVVYLASPHEFHAEQAIAAATAGRHVVVEKPMALSVDECSAMIAAAEASGTAVVVGHTHGFDPQITQLGRIVRDGTYGDVALVAMWNYTNFLYRPRRAAELDPVRGGGVVLNQVAHQVDMARTIVGQSVVAVRALTSRLDETRPVDGSCAALLVFEGGVAASLVYSGYDHFDSDELHEWVSEGGHPVSPRHGSARARLSGSRAAERSEGEAALRASSLGYGRRKLEPPERQPHFGEIVVTCVRADLRATAGGIVAYTDDGVQDIPIEQTPLWPGHHNVLDELIEAVHSGTAIHDGNFGRDTVEVCHAIQKSAATGTEVTLARRREQGRV